MSKDHQPHMLRAQLNEWCGGTEPPTIVTEDPQEGLLKIDIYHEGDNLHVGQILKPTALVEFAVPPNVRLSIPQIGDYAYRAIASKQ